MKEVVIAVTYNPRMEKYLILRRSGEKSKTGEWEFASGKIEEEEEDVKAVKREFREETVLEIEEIEEGESFREGDFRFKVFRIETFETEVELSSEHSDYSWVKGKDIPNPETADNMGCVLEAADE